MDETYGFLYTTNKNLICDILYSYQKKRIHKIIDNILLSTLI